MHEESKYPWFLLDMVVFVLLNMLLLYLFKDRLVLDVGVREAVFSGLAVFRLADVIANERVAKPLRKPFVKEQIEADKIVEVPKRRGFAGAMGSLIYCPSCVGVWISAALVYAYIFSPVFTKPVVLIFALSGVERIVTTLYNVFKKELVKN